MQIAGDGFVLREWYLEDAISLQQQANNPNVAACLLDRFPHPYTLSDAVGWLNTKIKQNPMVNFAIDVDGSAVGGIGLEMRQDVYRKTPLLGYWLGEDYWSRGIMPKAIRLITEYAFAQLDIICIQACILSKNPRSMRVLEKAGYQKQGILQRSVIKHEQIYDEHVYATFK
ncbi:GNAT family N-acetyltransferase [Mucilaginibacter sp. Bleaf8]|uniref:GNAT family N-acetyltransferase n=1 Tax=Mucilaginibacter sp. Bleaf8 TaxID=2834430 RepID=UPI001BCF804C|nr:GNAT family protein [Mucilaginibacter sp. Bleaf8]MBS7565943.1 GNAT family N-acetyltransferase [Mucilaginibacter sp. Bleaf8]